MDSPDDDFGDLYIDAEAQATYAVSGGADSVRCPGESECGADFDTIRSSETRTTPGPEAEAAKLVVVTRDPSRCVDDDGGGAPVEDINELEDCDSDDDLNIVLTDGDNEIGGCVNAAAYGVEESNDGSIWKPETGNGCVMPDNAKISGGMKMEDSADNACINPARGMLQCGYSFSLPWCRTMFGIRKPWRDPGADISDFFNFGFNEQSWEDYYKSLRQHCEHVKAVDTYFEDKTQVEPPKRSSDGGPRPSLVLLKGRAIDVEDRALERRPSVDLRRPRDPHPDVVIQIPVDNSVGELSGSTVEESGHLTTGELGASGIKDVNKRMHSSVDSTEEKASLEFQERRISSGEQSPSKENRCSPGGTTCAKEVIDEEEKEVCSNSDESDPYPVERESSPPDQIHFSPTPSYYVDKSEESDDSESESLQDRATDDQLEVYAPPHQTRLSEIDQSEYKVHKQNSIKAEKRNGTKRSRWRRSHEVAERNGIKRVRTRRSHEEPRKRHCRSPDYAGHRRIKLKNVRDASPPSDSDKEILARHRSSFCYSSKYRNNGQPFNSKKEDNDSKGLHASDKERLYSRMCASMDRGKHRKRQHTLGYQSNKLSLHPRGMEHSYDYDYEGEFEDYTGASSFKYPIRKSTRSFEEEEDPYGQHHCKRGYFLGRSAFLDDGDIRDRYRYDSLTKPFLAEKVPLTDRDHRCSLEYPSDNRRHNHQWGQENDRLNRNMYDHDYSLLRYQYEDEVHREKYGVPLELAYQRHSFGEPGRGKYPEYERDREFSAGGEIYGYTPYWRLDRFAPEKAGNNCRATDVRLSSSLSLRESRCGRGARSDFWRDDIGEFKVTESYDSLKNQLYKAGEREGWVHPERRRHKLKNDIRDTTRDVKRHEHPSNSDEMSVRYRRTSKCDWMSTKQITSLDKSHSYGRDMERYGSKKMIEDHDLSASIRTEQERALPKLQDPADIAAGQGKSGRRCSYGRKMREPLRRDEPRKLGGVSGEKPAQLQDWNMKEEGEIIDEARDVKGSEMDVERIRESLKKMEKRRERFKEPQLAKAVATGEPQAAELRPETDGTKQLQRPARKRRWCAT